MTPVGRNRGVFFSDRLLLRVFPFVSVYYIPLCLRTTERLPDSGRDDCNRGRRPEESIYSIIKGNVGKETGFSQINLKTENVYLRGRD